jgi:phosphoserine phosphatase
MSGNYQGYPGDVWRQIERSLAEVKKTQAEVYAAFDADGTLWDTDLGENFFKYQVRRKLFSCPYPDPWKHYRDWKKGGDPRPAYLWLAQVNAGQPLQVVRDWAESAVQEYAELPIFPAQNKLINWLTKEGVKVYVVTASIRWAVEPGAKRLGIPQDKVLGVETAVLNEVVTEAPAGFMTYKEGKPQALLAATKGVRPFLASGNTLGDQALLDCASHIRLAVTATNPEHELYPAEQELQKAASAKGWIQHRFNGSQ